MKARAIVTLSNENAPSRFRPSTHPQAAADAAVGAAHSRQPGRSARPVPPPSDEPAVLGLRAHRVDLTRRRNNRSPEREE
jgi:hypothetical protein